MTPINHHHLCEFIGHCRGGTQGINHELWEVGSFNHSSCQGRAQAGRSLAIELQKVATLLNRLLSPRMAGCGIVVTNEQTVLFLFFPLSLQHVYMNMSERSVILLVYIGNCTIGDVQLG